MELLPQQIKWLEALESGKYKQGRKILRRVDDLFCCLGVACEIAIEANVIEPAKLSDINRHVYVYDRRYTNLVPEKVIEYFRLRVAGGNQGVSALYTFNDQMELPFKEIAKRIRENPENFFVS